MRLEIPITPEEDRKLQKWLAKYNGQRRRYNQPEYGNYEQALKDFITRKIQDCKRSASQGEARELARKFVDFPEEKQRRIKAIVEE